MLQPLCLGLGHHALQRTFTHELLLSSTALRGSNVLCASVGDTMAVHVERNLRIKYTHDEKKVVWSVSEEHLEKVKGVELLTFAWRDRGCKRFLGGQGEELLGQMKALRTEATKNSMTPAAAAGEGLFGQASQSAYAQFQATTKMKHRLRDGESLDPLVTIPIPMPCAEDTPKKVIVKSGFDARSSLQVEVSSEALQHLREAALAWASSDSAQQKATLQKGTSIKWRDDKQQWVAKKGETTKHVQVPGRSAAAKARAKKAALKWLERGEGEGQSGDISDGDESVESNHGDCDA